MLRLRALWILCLAIASLAWVSPSAQAAPGLSFVDVGSSPSGVAASPDGQRIYVTNSASNSVSVISTATWSVTATISVGSGPTGIAVNSNGTRAVVANTTAGTYSVIDTGTLAVINTITSNAGCAHPTAVAYHPSAASAFAACGSTLSITYINVARGTAVRHSLGSHDVNDVTLSASANELIGVGGYNAVFVNSGWSPGVNPDPLAVATNHDASYTYTPHANGTMSRLKFAGSTVANFPIGQALRDVAITSDDRTVYVTDEGAGTVISVDPTTMRPITSYPAGTSPSSIALDPRGWYAYAVNASTNRLAVISLLPPASGSNVPTAPLQQFARTETQSCEAAPADLVDFPALGLAVRDDAWGASWAQWPNGGTGGFVCTRQPYFTTANTWAVR